VVLKVPQVGVAGVGANCMVKQARRNMPGSRETCQAGTHFVIAALPEPPKPSGGLGPNQTTGPFNASCPSGNCYCPDKNTATSGGFVTTHCWAINANNCLNAFVKESIQTTPGGCWNSCGCESSLCDYTVPCVDDMPCCQKCGFPTGYVDGTWCGLNKDNYCGQSTLACS